MINLKGSGEMKREEYVLKHFREQEDYMNERIKSGIEENRKGFGTVYVKDKNANPIKNANIKFVQKDHEFKYGANLFMLDEFNKAEQNEKYKKLFADAFNMATLPFYWSDLEPEKGKPRYDKNSCKVYRRPTPELCLEYCENNNITPKAHCLVYDPWTPEWLADKDVYEIKYYYEKRMSELAERFKGRINGWEVINETLCNSGRTALWDTEDMVEWSFDTARKYFNSNELIINEAAHVWSKLFMGNRSPYYMQIERALKSGHKIDAIGMQYHMFNRLEDEKKETDYLYNPENVYMVLDRYADFKLPMQITEITISNFSYDKIDEDIQAEVVKNLYSMWFSHSSMEAVIYWNLVDGFAAFAPQGDMKAGENYFHGGLIRYDFTPKPAYYVIKDLFEKQWHTEGETRTNEYGSAIFKGFYGNYDIEVTVNGKTTKHEFNLSGKQKKSWRYSGEYGQSVFKKKNSIEVIID